VPPLFPFYRSSRSLAYCVAVRLAMLSQSSDFPSNCPFFSSNVALRVRLQLSAVKPLPTFPSINNFCRVVYPRFRSGAPLSWRTAHSPLHGQTVPPLLGVLKTSPNAASKSFPSVPSFSLLQSLSLLFFFYAHRDKVFEKIAMPRISNHPLFAAFHTLNPHGHNPRLKQQPRKTLSSPNLAD